MRHWRGSSPVVGIAHQSVTDLMGKHVQWQGCRAAGQEKKIEGWASEPWTRLSLNSARRKSWGRWAIQGSRNSLRADSVRASPMSPV